MIVESRSVSGRHQEVLPGPCCPKQYKDETEEQSSTPLLPDGPRERRDRARGNNRSVFWSIIGIFMLGTVYGFVLFPAIMSLYATRAFPISPVGREQPPHDDRRGGDSFPFGGPKPSGGGEGIVPNNGSSNRLAIRPNVTFDDLLGMDEAKSELMEIVSFLKEPSRYHNLGAKLPRGVMLVGPPGTGKTQLARAVAREANVPFLWASGSEFVELYVGQGAKRVRELFQLARHHAPCILFIDEIDAVGGKRGLDSGGAREYSQTLNQILTEIDGFNSTASSIVVLAATNRIDVLDPALLRPGRFDRHVHVSLPDAKGREAILQHYLKTVPHQRDSLNLGKLARGCVGMSGAALRNLVNEGALMAARDGAKSVSDSHLQRARDKVSMGPERTSLALSATQKKSTAYHEAGHAIVAHFLQPDAHPIHKVTIIPRGTALGYVEQLPEEDLLNFRRAECHARLAVAMAGRAAEEIVFGRGNVTSGASSDFAQATEMAYKMVTEWGMSDIVGPLNYRGRRHIGDGGGKTRWKDDVDAEVRRLCDEAMRLADRILRKNRPLLEKLAHALLQNETLSGADVARLLGSTATSYEVVPGRRKFSSGEGSSGRGDDAAGGSKRGGVAAWRPTSWWWRQRRSPSNTTPSTSYPSLPSFDTSWMSDGDFDLIPRGHDPRSVD